MAIRRDIKYIDRDFTSLRNSLINYTKTYFPNTYNDFTPASPGMMFMEMAAYVGDVLSFYVDNQFQETFIQYSRQTQNLYDLAYMLGYKPKATNAATAILEVYQQLPAVPSGSPAVQVPDYTYALQIPSNTTVTSNLNGSIQFLTTNKVNFAFSSSTDPTEVTVYQTAGGVPTFFLVKKFTPAISATIKSTTFSFTSPVSFDSRTITDTNIIGILDIIDNTTGDKWYEVDYLAQDAIYETIANANPNDPNYLQDPDVANLLRIKSVQNRFATRFLNKTNLQIQFGSGNPTDTTEVIIPNPDNVGLGLPTNQSKLTTAYAPTNFIFTNTYGIAPSNTTLTVRYLTGGGVTSNVPANSITNLNTNNIKFLNSNLNSTTAQYIFNSLAANNESAASGGEDGDTIDELRQNTISNFNSQMRNVTADDYLVRALSMPGKYGIVSKAFTQKPKPEVSNTTLEIFVLSYDINKKLTLASTALKSNLKRYLNQYRMIGDSLSIKDAFVLNIGCDFEIITLPNYNNNEVLINCISTLQNYFDITKWQINQPIILRELYNLLDNVNGIQTVKNITITNKTGTNLGYSQYAYDIPSATSNGIIYPSLDPSIFEVKYLNEDIKGKVVTL
jgi:hypothetical protein